jgi:Secretion system C-terminal sorting domain
MNSNTRNTSHNQNYTTFADDKKIQDKKVVYEMITDYPTMRNKASVNAFYNNLKNKSVGQLKDVEDLIGAKNYSAAKVLNTTISSTCTADADLQSFYQAYLQYMSDTACCDTSAYSVLYNLGMHCPEQSGIVVYKARALYDKLSKRKHTYADKCNPNTGNSRTIRIEDNTTSPDAASQLHNHEISLYPNPNSGSFTLQVSGEAKQELTIVLIDVTGKVLMQQKLNTIDYLCEVDVSQLKKGFYLLKVNATKTIKLFIE